MALATSDLDLTELETDFRTFAPGDYLTEYYSTIGSENDALLSFCARAYESLDAGSSLVEIGGGPTVYQLIAAAGRGAQITFADPVIANHEAVIAWLDRRPGAFDWRPYVQRALQHEGMIDLTGTLVDEREAQLREALKHLRLCDVLATHPLGKPVAPFDAVGSHFVTESITGDRAAWREGLANLVGLVRPGGRLVLSSLLGARAWRSGDRAFAAVSLTVEDVEAALTNLGVRIDVLEAIEAESGGAGSQGHQGYAGMVFASGLVTR